MYRNSIIKWFFILLAALASYALQAAQSRGISMESRNEMHITPFKQGVYRALVIGNDRYQDKAGKWQPLKTAVNDAKAVYQLLSNDYGFEDTRLLINATRKDILLAMQDLSKRVMKNDNVLIYYAGHGFMDEDSQKGFWVPVDAEGLDNTTFLRNSTIRDELTTIASRGDHTLLISDSCFSGTLLRRGNRGISSTEATESYYKKVASKKSVQIMSAGGVEFVDDNYNTSGHSPFTYFLLNELKNNDRPLLAMSELSNNVTRAVANNVDQTPESGVLQGAGDELGEFIFVKINLAVKGVPADRVKVQLNVVSEDELNQQTKAAEKHMPDYAVPMPGL